VDRKPLPPNFLGLVSLEGEAKGGNCINEQSSYCDNSCSNSHASKIRGKRATLPDKKGTHDGSYDGDYNNEPNRDLSIHMKRVRMEGVRERK